jgi:hypothetical protein
MDTPGSQKRERQIIALEKKQSIINASELKPKIFKLVTHFINKYGDSIIRTKYNDKIHKAIVDDAGRKRGTPRNQGKMQEGIKEFARGIF